MSNTIENIDNISLIIGNYFILLLLIILILLIAYYFLKRLFIKNKMRKISPDDLEIINKFYNNDICYSLLSRYDDLAIFIEEIDFACMHFYEMKRKISELEVIFEWKIDKVIKKCDNQKVIEHYQNGLKAINVILKYYDKNGNRKI